MEKEYYSNHTERVVQQEIKSFLQLPYEFIDFIDFNSLVDGDLNLKLIKHVPADLKRNWVPSYHFNICLDEISIGKIDLRIGYTEGLYYGGNIGYEIQALYRGHGYAGKACLLIACVARAHGMKQINITNEYTNHASRRVCEKIGAKLVRIVKLPEDNDMREDGDEYKNIFVWNIEEFKRSKSHD